MGLKREHLAALILFSCLNALLFWVNLTDLQYVWFANSSLEAYELSQYVHEGTYLLIGAILLAVVILLYYFRGNQNFYPKNHVLKVLAYGWLVQNAILAFSVAVRNYRYIDAYGLAFKRIGVFVFLALVLIGIFWMFLKIRDCKTFYFLLHRNSWSAYFLLLLVATVNWDVAITRYNLQATITNGIDADFLINDISDQNLFLLEKNIDRLEQYASYPSNDLRRQIKAKRVKFWKHQASLSWLSWTWSDHRNRETGYSLRELKINWEMKNWGLLIKDYLPMVVSGVFTLGLLVLGLYFLIAFSKDAQALSTTGYVLVLVFFFVGIYGGKMINGLLERKLEKITHL